MLNNEIKFSSLAANDFIVKHNILVRKESQNMLYPSFVYH